MCQCLNWRVLLVDHLDHNVIKRRVFCGGSGLFERKPFIEGKKGGLGGLGSFIPLARMTHGANHMRLNGILILHEPSLNSRLARP